MYVSAHLSTKVEKLKVSIYNSQEDMHRREAILWNVRRANAELYGYIPYILWNIRRANEEIPLFHSQRMIKRLLHAL